MVRRLPLVLLAVALGSRRVRRACPGLRARQDRAGALRRRREGVRPYRRPRGHGQPGPEARSRGRHEHRRDRRRPVRVGVFGPADRLGPSRAADRADDPEVRAEGLVGARARAAARGVGQGRAGLRAAERRGARERSQRVHVLADAARQPEARGSFDSLPIPFRAIATDVATRGTVVLVVAATWRGPCARAPRSPWCCGPVHIGDQWLVDGGIAENTPVNVARELGAQRSWISLLPFAGPDPKSFDDPLTITTVLLNSLFEQDYDHGERSRRAHHERHADFENLDFSRATTDSLIQVGRAAARAAFAGADVPQAARRRRRAPCRLPTVVRQVGVLGRSHRRRRPRARRTRRRGGRAAGRREARRRGSIRSAGTSATARSGCSRAAPGRDVTLHVQLDPAPQRSFGVGVAFDQFMSGRLWVGGIDRTLLSGDAEGVALAKLGTYEQDLDVFVRRRALVGKRYVPFTVEAKIAHESVRLFSGDGELPSAETRELVGFIGLKQDPSADMWHGEIGVDARLWREPLRNTRGTFGIRASVYPRGVGVRDGIVRRAARLHGLPARPARRQPPLAGRGRDRPDHARARRLGQPASGPGDVRAGRRRRVRRLQDRRAARVAGGVRQPPPPEAAESRCCTRGSKSCRARWRPATGVLPRVPDTTAGELFGGVRAGLEAATPVGPIRVEEGVANTGQRAILIRVGHWF